MNYMEEDAGEYDSLNELRCHKARKESALVRLGKACNQDFQRYDSKKCWGNGFTQHGLTNTFIFKQIAGFEILWYYTVNEVDDRAE